MQIEKIKTNCKNVIELKGIKIIRGKTSRICNECMFQSGRKISGKWEPNSRTHNSFGSSTFCL